MKFLKETYIGITSDRYVVTITNRGESFTVEFERNDFDNAAEALDWIEELINRRSPWYIPRRPIIHRYFSDLVEAIYPDPNETPCTTYNDRLQREISDENLANFREFFARIYG